MFTWHLQRKPSPFNHLIFFIFSSKVHILCHWKKGNTVFVENINATPNTSGLPLFYLHFPFITLLEESLIRGKFCVGKEPDANQLVGTSESRPFTPNLWYGTRCPMKGCQFLAKQCFCPWSELPQVAAIGRNVVFASRISCLCSPRTSKIW